ncbi:gliding motility-associated C-terminal domain-containing protein [Cytophagaceae bacterium ABcell3]|nr:gliding motility-associated C-terminal domain-containing protein [Cytophagaceae bacterium ABcell3]
MNAQIKYLLALLLLIGASTALHASHIRAGEITAQRVSENSLTFRFTLTLYLKISSGIDQRTADFDFGDGTTRTVNVRSTVNIGNDTERRTYVVEHTYGAAGNYRVSFVEIYRNAGIRNISNSERVELYLQTAISINPFMGVNNTPVLLNPPIDRAVVGETFIHNPGAFDIDGDSISYRMTIPRMGPGVNAPGYRDPNDPAFGGGSLNLDPVTGDLVWDAPAEPGIYNVAFLIEEWRDGQRISHIVRDMQIEVINNRNRKPELVIPEDTCLVAGKKLERVIEADDPDGHRINLSSVSGIYLQDFSDRASFSASGSQLPIATGDFEWQTTCGHVRKEPYHVLFKAEDIPGGNSVRLVDMKTWQIFVYGPEPTGLKTTPEGREMLLEWDDYSCPDARAMAIYRKECDPGVELEPCDDYSLENNGFRMVGRVPIGTTSWTDTNRGEGLNKGSEYCYVIVAEFPDPGAGRSFPSEEVCGGLIPDEPLFSNVSVNLTDSLAGEITVRWMKPPALTGEPAFEYRLYRTEGIDGQEYTHIHTANDIDDTTFVDVVDNATMAYSYRVDFYHNGGEYLGRSERASSVWLQGAPGDERAILSWEYDVPWNTSGFYHRIYRSVNGESFSLHDSLMHAGDAGSYVDVGLQNDDTVCYYVETVGEYCREIFTDIYYNTSQEVCIIPRDSIEPCPPVLEGLNCAERDIDYNDLYWTLSVEENCLPESYGYKVYFAPHEDEELEHIADVQDEYFRHIDTVSTAGCYAISAVNYYGMEGAKSNKVCVDLCVGYDLPNLITPNNDGYNDFFVPLSEPLNVESVLFNVYNRWGALVYSSNDNINLDWDGKNFEGYDLKEGVYYYSAEVTYRRRLRKEDQVKTLKGWVHIYDRNPLSD